MGFLHAFTIQAKSSKTYFPMYLTCFCASAYLDEMMGMPIQNLWDDVSIINNRSTEILGYPTQKPLALLERIINTCSNPDDVVLDPFYGCGTAIIAAEKLGRHWIGIDYHASFNRASKVQAQGRFQPRREERLSSHW